MKLSKNFSILLDTKHNLNYFIKILEFYSRCRPHQHNVSTELSKCIYSCYPEQINQIQQKIKDNTDVLKFIIFPEEFPMKENELRKEMFLLLQKDDIDVFISFLSKNPTIEITKEQKVEKYGYYYYLFECTWENYSISLNDFCCLFGSLKCFKYLLLNKCKITNKTVHYSMD